MGVSVRLRSSPPPRLGARVRPFVRDVRYLHNSCITSRLSVVFTAYVNMSDITQPKSTPLKKVTRLANGGCFLCGREEANSRKRRALGRSVELNEKLFKVLPLSIDELQDHHHRYICETPCYRELEKFFKLKENTETLRISILKRFEERSKQSTKRCLPSDVQPHQSPEAKRQPWKSLHSGGRAHKSLTFSSPVTDACESAVIVKDTQAQPIKPTGPNVHLGPWPITAVAKMISPGFLFCYKPSAPPLAVTANLEDSVNEDTSTVKVSHHVDSVL